MNKIVMGDDSVMNWDWKVLNKEGFLGVGSFQKLKGMGGAPGLASLF